MIFGRRKTIGVFFSGFDAAFSEVLYETIQRHLELLDADAVFFSTISYFQNGNRYDAQENRLFEIAPLEDLDGVVIVPDSYIMQGYQERLIGLLEERTRCPIVTLRAHEGPGSHVYTDEKDGIRPLVRHLIEKHHLTRLAFVTGYAGHADAQRRLNGFLEEMRLHHLPVPEEAVYSGDMWITTGPGAYRHFYEETMQRPEAIICANDYMAKGVMDTVRAHGLRVPEDVIVTGFDHVMNLGDAGTSLTTISQDYEEMIHRSMLILMEQMGRPAEAWVSREEAVPGRLILGQSCGCLKPTYEDLARFIAGNVHTRDTERNREINNTYLNIGLSGADNFADMHQALVHQLPVTEDQADFYICLFVKEEAGRCLLTQKPESRACLISAIENGRDGGMPMILFDSRKLLPEEVPGGERPRSYFMSLLHQQGNIYGYSMLRLTRRGRPAAYFQHRNVMISGALRNIFLQNSLRALYEERRILSTCDPLTHVLNRRGFDERLAACWDELCRRRETVCFLSFDMDHLKQVNDNYGHPEGDRAIRLISRSILRAVGGQALVARMGGDEFLAFLSGCGEAESGQKIRAFREELAAAAEAEGIPYPVTCSAGATVVRLEPGMDPDQCIRRSDEALYIRKAVRGRPRSAGAEETK